MHSMAHKHKTHAYLLADVACTAAGCKLCRVVVMGKEWTTPHGAQKRP